MTTQPPKKRAPNNRTLQVNEQEREQYTQQVLKLPTGEPIQLQTFINRTLHGNLLEVLPLLPKAFADLIVLDPPYNLDKDFHGFSFKASTHSQYVSYLRSWFPQVVDCLKDTGSLYICGDWKCTSALQEVMEEHLFVLNRISWQREKGRGAQRNWKNGMEDIWFGVKNKQAYYFDVESVKQKRRVLAPYTANGKPKDWQEGNEGRFRLSYPSNFWDDISIPYWSMPENTDHPTQKPEKLLAKLILASSAPGDVVFDPFLGSGTTSVVAKKLGRQYVGIEQNLEYCIWAEKRLHLAETNPNIQGYADKVFWERNSYMAQKKQVGKTTEKSSRKQ